MDVLPTEFYQRKTPIVALNLLGKYLVRRLDNTFLIGKINETEAYLPCMDEASHGCKGERTRTSVLFGPAGKLYLHAMHRSFCMDIVTEGITIPGSVLIRGVIPVEGIEIMQSLRKTTNLKNITNGPGKVCQAFSITSLHNGVDVTNPLSEIVIINSNEPIDSRMICITPRIGISQAKDLPLRFLLQKEKIRKAKK